MMNGAFKIASLRGIPIRVHWMIAVGLFVSVLLHELAHSLYAPRKRGRVADITLLMIGGVSQMSELPPRERSASTSQKG